MFALAILYSLVDLHESLDSIRKDLLPEAVYLVTCERVMIKLDMSCEQNGHELFFVFLVPCE